MSKGRLFIIFGTIFGGVGVLLLGIAIVLAAMTASFLARADRTDGTVTALTDKVSTSQDSSGYRRTRTSWYPTVEFTTPDGRRFSFRGSVGSNPPAYDVGERVLVAYDPGDPSDARIATFWSAYLIPLIFGGIGVVFASIGVPFFVIGWRRLRLRSWLRRHGQEIWAEVAHVGRNANVRLNGRHPFVVQARWQDPRTGQTFTATSDYLKNDPSPWLTAQPGVRVLFDPDDPKRNFVDLGNQPAPS
ncbi:MAG TPA: DUF3592 domain-containing protein [Streptosporangiaceae bacterium]|jgi:hypothetical protein